MRRERRELLKKDIRDREQNPAKSKPSNEKQQPLKQVDNFPDNNTAVQTHSGTSPLNSSPSRSPVVRSENKTSVAFGRTTKVLQQQRSPSSKMHTRRYSLENDSVSI